MISVGVDIGTYSIKVAEVEATSKSYIVRRVQEFHYTPDLTKDRKIEIIDVLRTLFAQYDPERTQFIFGVPQRYVSARLLPFPFRERFKIQRAVVSQLEDELPFSPEDAIFDVHITRFNQKSADVMAFAVPKEHVGEVIDLAHDCGVEPKLVSSEGMGLANLFERWELPPPDALTMLTDVPGERPAEIVLQLGHASTEMLVYAEGLLQAVRHVDWGAKQIADAIGAKYGLNPVQAQRELQAKAFILLDKSSGTREQGAFSDVVESAVRPLAAQLKLMMLEMQSELRLQWTRGLMLGGACQLKNLGAYLTQSLNVPFNKYRQFDNHPAGDAQVDQHLELVTGVAVGLAIEGLRRPRNPAVNFMRGEFAQSSNAFGALWEKWGYAARMSGAAFAMLVVYSCTRDQLATTMLDRSNEVLGKQAQTIAGLKKGASPEKIRRFIKDQDALEKARKGSAKVTDLNSALDVLDQLTGAVPTRERVGLEIKRLSIDGELAEVHGYVRSAMERDQIAAAVRRIANGAKAEDVQLRIPVPNGRVGFAYKFRVKRSAGG